MSSAVASGRYLHELHRRVRRGTRDRRVVAEIAAAGIPYRAMARPRVRGGRAKDHGETTSDVLISLAGGEVERKRD